ncbi:hypothetical protein DV737_g4676, partial [Chaetothyriales sp. CBS 132003]
MAAQTFDVVAVVLPDPEIDDSPNVRIINASLGYGLAASDVVRTLSSNNPNQQNEIKGLLYVPDVSDASSACTANELALVPSNVTTLASFSPENYPFVALAPWTSPSCVQAYLASMRATAVRAAVVYHANGHVYIPPPVSDASWSLDDGGQWQNQNQFPVYAVSGAVGAELMTALARYSGSMSSAPLGNELVQQFDSRDLVRLLVHMDLSGGSTMPSLWIFLIIVLAILLTFVLVSSLIVHFVQRRQRILLARRVANGEVDLEALGIKRLNVPQQLLDAMPRYTFSTKSDTAVPVIGAPEVPFTQPTCPICLDDFVHAETIVRQLPCRHIFHPECIDPFLRDNSSLCPMCKKSALPPGYCPVNVTNLMVRRERLVRRMREQSAAENRVRRRSTVISAVQRRVRTMRAPSAPVTATAPSSNPNGTGHTYNGLNDMTSTASTSMPSTEVPAEVRAQGTSARRAWFRQRMARLREQEYSQAAEEARVVDETRPLWRRIVGRFNSRWE